jgi:predicted DNA-binding transcriptional regulator AlpA
VGHGGESVLKNLHRDFEEMELDEFFKMIIILSSSKLGLPYIAGARGIYAGGVDVLELTSAGTGMMMDWPKGLVDYLEEQRGHATPKMAGAGLSKIFENLFKRMKKLKDGPAKELLQNAIKDYLTERPISFNPKNANFVRGNERGGWSYVTLKEAAQILGVTTYRARGIAEEQGWIEVNKTTRHVTNVIPRELVDAYEEPEEPTLSHTDVMTRLGISKSALGALIKAKVVVPRPNKVDGRSDTRFVAAEVESLLTRLRTCSDRAAAVHDEVEELDVRQLANRMSPPPYSIGTLLALVLDGTLEPVRWDSEIQGVYAVRFDAANVAAYKAAASAKRPPTIKAGHATNRYGYSLEELAWLVNLRLVQVVHQEPDFRQSVLSTADLQQVTDTYLLERKPYQQAGDADSAPAAEHPELGRLFKVA